MAKLLKFNEKIANNNDLIKENFAHRKLCVQKWKMQKIEKNLERMSQTDVDFNVA